MAQEQAIQKIKTVLEKVRSNIQMDGGDIEFVKFEDGTVFVRLLGACVGCPFSTYTIKLGVEQALKEELKEVQEVIAVD